MSAATANQAKVLRALQNGAAAVQVMLERERTSGLERSVRQLRQFQDRGVAHAELAIAAQAGGVPPEWIAQARERGTKGIRWRAGMFLRTAAPVDREQLLTALDTDVARLASWTVLHAARSGGGIEIGTTTTVARNLRALWSRTCTVAALLDVTAEESHDRWAQSVWTAVDAAHREGLSDAAITANWRAIVHEDLSRYRVQATALAAAGIEPGSNIGPSHPDTAIAAISSRIVGPGESGAVSYVSSTSGAQITQAVEAALQPSRDLADDPRMQPPTFSDRQENYPGAEP
ncbi:hypothetical protein [Nocardia salmonicida]|uniref:hypothetical protein n=1 Tax=Nocardia salmonicida TaxID=53431 RepID=UPI0033DAD347